MKNRLILFFVIFILSIFIFGCAEQGSYTSTQTKAQTGRAVFTITDAAANMGSVSSVKVTIGDVKVHSETEGWITVSSSERTYDLLKLKAEGRQDLLADAQLKEGTYNQLRLGISEVVITDSSGEHEAKLPSGELKINGDLVVNANSTSTATFDFVAGESLHITGNGKYIMAPVVQLETREDADVDVKSNNKVEITSGKLKTRVKVGMDVNGNVGVGVKIPADLEISVDSGIIKIGGKSSSNVGSIVSAKGNAVFAITDAAANLSGVTSIKVTIDKIMVHSNTQGWVNVSTGSQTYDLLELRAKGAQALMANVNLQPDTYNQLRLDISKVTVTDSSGEQEAKLPSGELKIFGVFVVNADSTSTATFDFVAGESLHITGNGKYIMAPVVQLETKENANVSIKSNNEVEIKGGIVKSSVKVGMDIDGNVGVGRGIPSDANISIEAGKIKIKSKIIISY